MENIDTEQTLFVERYRPQRIEDCILPTGVQNAMQGFVDKGTIPNILAHGSAGSGKSAAAVALCKQLGYDWIMINGSDEGRFLETLRNRIRTFASSVSFGGNRKCVILDEADYMPADTVQPALRAFIEEYANNCSFILTCNFPNRLIDPLHSRCTSVNFTIPASERSGIQARVFRRCIEIMDNEGIEYDKATVAELVKIHFPDFRRVINEIQRHGISGKIDSSCLVNHGEAEIDSLIGMLRERDFGEIRKWVATNPTLDMGVLVRNLYDRIYEYSKDESIPTIVITMADYQYKHTFAIDAEVNIMAMLTQLMMEVEFK